MNLGQTMLTIAALFLFSITTLNVNRGLSETDQDLAQSRYRNEALSILTSYIQKSTTRYFDEITTDTTSEKTLANFTIPDSLGADGNDGGVVDDFDDYHNQTMADTGSSGIVYQLSFEVDYVDRSGTVLVSSNTATFHKRMTGKIYDNMNEPLIYKLIADSLVRDTLTISYVQSYWFYN